MELDSISIPAPFFSLILSLLFSLLSFVATCLQQEQHSGRLLRPTSPKLSQSQKKFYQLTLE